jgi:hypothetical protein
MMWEGEGAICNGVGGCASDVGGCGSLWELVGVVW